MFDAFKIAVTLHLVDNASEGVLKLAKQFKMAGNEVTQLKSKLASIQGYLGFGGISAAMGVGLLSMLKKPLEEASKIQKEVAKGNAMGLGEMAMADAAKFAAAHKMMGNSMLETLTLRNDALAIFKDSKEANAILPVLQEINFVNKTLYDDKGPEHSAQFQNFMKVIEMRGGTKNAEDAKEQGNMIEQVINASRGRVTGDDFRTAMSRGRTAFSRRDNSSFYYGSEALIQELGASQYGTGAAAVYNSAVNMHGSLASKREMDRLGMLDKSQNIYKNGKLMNSSGQGRLADVAMADGTKMGGGDLLAVKGELAFMNQFLLPMFKKNGITSDKDILHELGIILGSSTANGLMAKVYQQRETFARSEKANSKAENIDQAKARSEKTLAGQKADFDTKLETLQGTLGMAVLPLAIKELTTLNPMLEKMAIWIGNNGPLTKTLVAGFVSLGIALVGLGVISIVVGGLQALGVIFGVLATGFALVSSPVLLVISAIAMLGMIAAELWENWDYLVPKIKSIWSSFTDSLVSMSKRLISFLHLGGTDAAPGLNPVRTAPPPPATPVAVNMYLDQQKVGRATFNYAGREASRPLNGTTKFDGGMAPIYPIGGGSW